MATLGRVVGNTDHDRSRRFRKKNLTKIYRNTLVFCAGNRYITNFEKLKNLTIMLRRFVNNNILLQIQILRPTIQPLQRYTRSISAIYAVHTKNIQIVPQRLYSEKLKVEELTVDYNQVKNATANEKILIIDVREPEEIKEHGKIPNSINIPLGNVSTALGTMSESEFQTIYKRQKPTEESEIIFYCMIGKRSGMAQQNAINLGYKNVKNYLGSWNDWASKL